LSSVQERFPELARRLDHATCIGAERGAVTVTRQLKSVHRGAVALVGDASGSVDAITGDGLTWASGRRWRSQPLCKRGISARISKRTGVWHAGRRSWDVCLLLLDSQPKPASPRHARSGSASGSIARLLAVHIGATSPRHLAETGALAWLAPRRCLEGTLMTSRAFRKNLITCAALLGLAVLLSASAAHRPPQAATSSKRQ